MLDRLLLNGLIQPFQQRERVIGFLNTYRQQYPVSRDVLRETATQFPNWVVNRSRKWDAPILEAPEERRDKFLDPYFRKAKTSQVVAVVKGREPARIMIAIGNKKENRWHLDIAQRWVVQMQYNFYVHDEHWGRMFVRMCPYLPFSARVCLNQHHWLAVRMREEGIDFQQCTNAFLKCSNPAHLQELADSLRARDLLNCGQKWLATFTPFFTERERKQAGCQRRLFFAQVELCDNLIFRRRAALDQMGERLLDGNRTIGQRGRRMPVENDSFGPRAGKPEIFLQTSFNERMPALSPDGRWLAYSSDESGKSQVYVRAFPDGGAKCQISTDDGYHPVWSPNGKELFFLQNREREIMTVRYTVHGQSFVPDKPQAWSDKKLANTPTTRAYDVSLDGRSVIALLPSEDSDEEAAAHELTFLFNFRDEVRRRAAAGTLR